MSLEFSSFDIEGPLLIQGKRHFDDRGFFTETFQREKFEQLGVSGFVQDNMSRSRRGVFRGLHWQASPYGQGKLVSCVAGEIIDFVVDVRVSSSTYMRSLAVPLSGARQESFWVPEGFAHGFLSLTDDTLVSYKVTNFWHKESERSLSMRVLPIEEYIDTSLLIVSEKDLEAPLQLS